MENCDCVCSVRESSWFEMIKYRLQRVYDKVKYTFIKPPESNLIKHAKDELRIAGYDLNQKEEDPNKWICENILELLEVFCKQGHSGFSAPYCIRVFSKLANFEPLNPLTGDDSEWEEVGTGVFQNKRCSHVFKENGRAYDIEGRIFREPDGGCYMNHDSRVFITFPYIPKREYVDVPERKEGDSLC